MNFFSRKPWNTEIAIDTATDQNAQRIVHREIEVKVERTWTALSARVPNGEGAAVPPTRGESQVAPPAPLKLDEGSR